MHLYAMASSFLTPTPRNNFRVRRPPDFYQPSPEKKRPSKQQPREPVKVPTSTDIMYESVLFFLVLLFCLVVLLTN